MVPESGGDGNGALSNVAQPKQFFCQPLRRFGMPGCPLRSVSQGMRRVHRRAHSSRMGGWCFIKAGLAHSVHPRDILLLDADQAFSEPGQAVGVQCGGHGGPQTANIGAWGDDLVCCAFQRQHFGKIAVHARQFDPRVSPTSDAVSNRSTLARKTCGMTVCLNRKSRSPKTWLQTHREFLPALALREAAGRARQSGGPSHPNYAIRGHGSCGRHRVIHFLSLVSVPWTCLQVLHRHYF